MLSLLMRTALDLAHVAKLLQPRIAERSAPESTALTICLRRREFITLLGGAAAWPLVAHAQQGGRVRRISVLIGGDENDPVMKARISALTQALAGLGWTDPRNMRMDLRWGRGDINRIRALAQELVGLQPEGAWPTPSPAYPIDRRVNSRHNCKKSHEIRTSRIFPALRFASRVMVGITEPETPLPAGPGRGRLRVLCGSRADKFGRKGRLNRLRKLSGSAWQPRQTLRRRRDNLLGSAAC